MPRCEPMIEQAINTLTEAEGSIAAVARKLGFTRQYLSGVLSGKWQPSDKLLKKLGLVRRTVVEEG